MILRPLNILGVDPSINACGFAYLPTGVATLHQKTEDGDRRYIEVRDRTRYYIRQAERDDNPYLLAVIEGPSYNSTGYLFQLGMVRCAVQIPLFEHGVQYVTVAPTTAKVFATGDSKATKQAMMQTARQASGLVFADDNQADAWWLRQMGLAAADTPTRVRLTDDKVERLAHVQWPLSIDPYGPDAQPADRTPLIRRCRHDMYSMRTGRRPEAWIHPFDLGRCTRPPA